MHSFKKFAFLILAATQFNFTSGNKPEPDTTTLEIEFSNIKNNKGNIMLAVFDDEESFPDKSAKAVKKLSVSVSEIKNSRVVVEGLPSGKSYAISVMHDENLNKKMDFTPFGIPKEGYGFSNNPTIRFKAPSFQEAKFSLQPPRQNIIIKLNY